MTAQRLTTDQLLRVFNSARNEESIGAALRRVQDAVLAKNGHLTAANADARGARRRVKSLTKMLALDSNSGHN